MLAELQRELSRVGIFCCVALLLLAAAFSVLESGTFAWRWLCVSAACWLLVCWQCWKLLPLNKPRDDAPLYPALGAGSMLTLLRALFIACTAGFLLNPFANYWLGFVPAVLYTVAAICDRIDGYVARRQQRTTLLGSEFDTIVDALGLVVAPLLAVLYGKIHVSYLLVSAAFYLFRAGLYWRRRQQRPVYPLLPNPLRRTMAGFQMGFVAGALWPPLHTTMTQLFGMAFMVPLLIGFWVDWLVVSGRLDTRTNHWERRFAQLSAFTRLWLMPVLRLALVVLLLRASLSNTSPLPASAALLLLFSIAYFLCLFGILIGFLGRACATLMMLLLCWQFPFQSPDADAVLTIASTVMVILFGTGRFSLRSADESWINRQDGA